jgi:hypothetical protein
VSELQVAGSGNGTSGISSGTSLTGWRSFSRLRTETRFKEAPTPLWVSGGHTCIYISHSVEPVRQNS